MVFYSALCDIIGSIFTALGTQRDRTVSCSIQGYFANFFPLCGLFWMVMANYSIYRSLLSVKLEKMSPTLISSIFTLISVLTLLPLSSDRFGATHEDGWCFLAPNSNSKRWTLYFWVLIARYVWVYLAICSSIFFMISISIKIHQLRKLQSQYSLPEKKRASVGELYLYPSMILICWIAPTIMDTYKGVSTDQHADTTNAEKLAIACPICQGIITAIIFLTTNPFVRRKLYSKVTGRPVAVESRGSNVSNIANAGRRKSQVNVNRRSQMRESNASVAPRVEVQPEPHLSPPMAVWESKDSGAA